MPQHTTSAPLTERVIARAAAMSPARFAALAALSTLAPAALLVLAAGPTGLDLVPDEVRAQPVSAPTTADAIGYIAFAPLAETLVIALLVALMRRLTSDLRLIIAVPTVLFGAAHGLLGTTTAETVIRILGSTWAFLVFTVTYVAWSRNGRWRGIGMAAGVHAFHNGVVIALWAVVAGL